MKYALFACILFSSLCSAQTQTSIASTEDISGMYTFLKDGEFVQINVDGDQLTGFVSRYGDTDSDKGAFLDHMFKSAELKGDTVHFVTKNVHGIYYEFTGTVQHTDQKDPNKEGYRVLKGKLIQYSDEDAKKTTGKSREVTLKSFPVDALVNH